MIQYIDNQPIQLYKVAAGSNERQWDQTAYHKRQGNCFFEGPDYCHPVLNTDLMTFQFKLPTVGDSVIGPIYDSVYIYSQNTAVSTGQLIDASATFVSSGVQNDELVISYDNAINNSSWVSNVDSDTTLDLVEDIFPSFPNYYGVSTLKGNGNWKYNGQTNKLSISTAISSQIYLENALVVDQVYKVTIKVDSVTAGSFSVFLGDNNIATINSVGTHVIYGQCQTTTEFKLTASSAFIGVISDAVGESITVTPVETEFTIGIFDLDGNFVTSFVWDATVNDAYTIGNCAVSKLWSTLDLECGKYIIGLYEGDVTPCTTGMMTNGNFAGGSTGWTLGTNMSIAAGHMEFIEAPAEAFAANNLACSIKAGFSYTITFDVATVDAIKSGHYILPQFSLTTQYNLASQTSVSLTLTAIEDSDTLQIYCADECTAQFDNFTLTCNNCVLDQNDADGLSECYCVCDSHDCTMLIEYNASAPTFGNYFPLDDNMMIRVTGRIRNPETPDIDYDPFKSTMGVQHGGYANLQRKEEFVCTLAPEWVHNTLAVALSHEVVYVDGIRYKRLANYQPKWGNSIELCEGLCPVAQYDQSNLRSTY